MKFKPAYIFILSATVFTFSASAESLAEKIKKRSGEIAEVKALLNDPDQNTRAAAIDVMLKSDDTAMREIAYSTGFNSADDSIRAIALRNKLNETDSFTMYFTLPEDASAELKKQYDYFGGSLTLLFKEYNERTGKFKVNSSKQTSSASTKPGNVSGLTFTFNTRYCGGTLSLNEESELEGIVTCEKFKFHTKAAVI
jgi:hypothetical protein